MEFKCITQERLLMYGSLGEIIVPETSKRLKDGNILYANEIQSLLCHLNLNRNFMISLPVKFLIDEQCKEIRERLCSNYTVTIMFPSPITFGKLTSSYNVFIQIHQGTSDSVTFKSLSPIFDTEREIVIPNEKVLSMNNWTETMVFGEIKLQNTIVLKAYIESVFRGKKITDEELGTSLDYTHKIINISDVRDGFLDYSNMKFGKTKIRGKRSVVNNSFGKYIVKKDDLIFTCRGSEVRCAMYNGEETVIPSINVVVLRLTNKMLANYLNCIFQLPIGKSLLSSIEIGNTIINLNETMFKTLEIPISDFSDTFLLGIIEKYNSILKEKSAFEKELNKKMGELNDIIRM